MAIPVIEAYGDKVKLRANAIDETNNVYGKIKVIAPVRIKGERKIKWHCVCECGNENYFFGTELREGKRTSCGNRCNNIIEEIPGTIYGFLEVIERDPEPAYNFPDRCIHWFCKCSLCNTVKSISGRNLRDGTTKSCGCLESYGERLVAKALQELNIPYIKEYTFEDLKSPKGNRYRFDFAIPKKDTEELQFIIEFNGCQHFKDTMSEWQKLEERQDADKIKKQYCTEHHINQLYFNSFGNHQFEGTYEEILTEIKNFYEDTKEEQWYVKVCDYNFGEL